MLLARICGHATATVKHPSLAGCRMLLAQPLRSLTREPLLVLDRLGAHVGDLVLITSDGRGARAVVGRDDTPVRWTVAGVVDDGRAYAENVPG